MAQDERIDPASLHERSHHDMGGLAADAINQSEHEKAAWEKRVDALVRLVLDQDPKLVTVDELRRGIEAIGPEAYDRYSYYERWMESITRNLLEKDVLTVSELGERMAQVRAREEAARK
ncbi:MAG: hypothetical protein AB8C46_16440 [Burkholderiaceae bacterium]